MIRPSGDVSSVNGSTNFVEGKYYHFYDFGLTDKDPLFYRQLLAQAKKSIVIWDPHYRDVKMDLFSVIKQDNVYIEILTICYNGESKNDMTVFANDVKDAINVTDVPHCIVRVNALMPSYLRKWPWTEWHDRFLIIDNTEVYLIGASLSAQNNTDRSFGICQLVDPMDKDIVMRSYEAYRNSIKDGSGGVDGNGYKCLASR